MANSTVEGAGRGVFLKKAVKAGTVVGFYNGVRLVGLEASLGETVRRSPYRMDNDWATQDEIIDVPPKYRYAEKFLLRTVRKI